MKHKYQCKVCNDDFESEKRLSRDNRYCGYCEAVHKGEPDARWIPSITKEDIDLRGFQGKP